MISLQKLVAFFAVAAVLVGSAIVWFALRPEVPLALVSKQSVRTHLSAPSAAGEIASTGAERTDKAAVNSSESAEPKKPTWAQRLTQETDLRRYALAAMRQPESGGVRYARHALQICIAARNALLNVGESAWRDWTLPYSDGQDSRVYAERTAAFESIRARCASFSDAEQFDGDLKGRANADYLYASEGKILALGRSGQTEERRAAIDLLTSGADPLLIEDILARLLLTRHNGHLGYWFEGQHLQVNDADGQAFHAAVQAAPCLLGLPCTVGLDPVLLGSCVVQGKCFRDRVALLESEIPAQMRMRFRLYLDSLVRILNGNGNKAALLAPA